MKQCSSHAVIGLGFGDEGKGMRVHALSHHFKALGKTSLVIRYSGGQQAGHTVCPNENMMHVFSSFGSGTFNDAPTYWSKYCTVDPLALMTEFNVLRNKGVTPKLLIDKKAPVTTPYDIFHNQHAYEYREDGTCGRGVGATFQREEDFYSLLAGDLLYESVFKEKLKHIRQYYHLKGDMAPQFEFDFELFFEARESMLKLFEFVDEIPNDFDEYIFEGSQGLMLDQNFGFFPHVTRSSVGTKNILEMGFEPVVHMMTRAYQTRHGNGPMTNLDWSGFQNKYESNKTNKYQGEFKTSILDLDLLKYVIGRDDYIRTNDTNLVITCMDIVEDDWKYTLGNKIFVHVKASEFVDAIKRELGAKYVDTTSTPWLK